MSATALTATTYQPTTFDHNDSPEPLVVLNHQLVELLNLSELNDQDLLSLVNKRDELIENHLKSLENQKELQKNFAQSELTVNNKLIEICQRHLSDSESQLINIVRGKKAIKEYK